MGLVVGRHRQLLQRTGTEPMQYGTMEGAVFQPDKLGYADPHSDAYAYAYAYANSKSNSYPSPYSDSSSRFAYRYSFDFELRQPAGRRSERIAIVDLKECKYGCRNLDRRHHDRLDRLSLLK